VDSRRTIGRAVGTLAWATATLTQAQRGADRALTERVRAQLKAASADLLVLRAHLSINTGRLMRSMVADRWTAPRMRERGYHVRHA
jgi:hypothetical protein